MTDGARRARRPADQPGARCASACEHAVATEKFMLRLGWLVLALAVTSLAVTAALWLHGDITMEQALAAIFGVIITGILSGAAAYASGINVGLGASRLVLAMEAEEEQE